MEGYCKISKWAILHPFTFFYAYHFNVVIFQAKRGAKAFENPWKGEMLRKIQNGQIQFLW